MPAPALGTQLLTTSGGPAVYAPVAQAAQVGPLSRALTRFRVLETYLVWMSNGDLHAALQYDGAR